jgi:hypothetical protein
VYAGFTFLVAFVGCYSRPVPAARSSFALAALLALAAPSGCHHGSLNATDAGDGGAVDAQGDAPHVNVDRKLYSRVLNPPGPEGTLFFAGSGEGCHRAKAPHPEQVPDLNAAELAPCPDALRDPAWNRCPEGTMFATVDLKKCLCVTGGATPQANEVPCPEAVK